LVKIQRTTPLNEEHIKEIEETCLSKRAMFIKIEPGYGQDIGILENMGYKTSLFPMVPATTIFIDLTLSEGELWNNVSKSGKYSIKRAEREGAKVEVYTNPGDKEFDIYYAILKETGTLKKFYVPPIKQLKKMRKSFGDKGHLAIVYEKDGSPAGAKYFIGSEDNALYVNGGTSGQGRNTKAGYALLWKSILFLKNAGYNLLDLEGKDDPRFPSFTKNWEGFSYFKEKFGGEEIEFPYPHVKYYSPIIKSMVALTGMDI
jgi:lipid II:glycine glycyltransferase (peptidoglycan interpeptide bridge formation enzyme)